MLDPIACFVQQLLRYGKFCFSRFAREAHQGLLTAVQTDEKRHVVMLPEVILRAKDLPGCLIVDDTGIEKYGLKRWARTLFNHAKRQFGQGYKLLLFLWRCEEGYLPLGFALWAKDSPILTELVLNGFSILRNQYRLKPNMVLADAYFLTLKVSKRLNDYGWGFVMRCKKTRQLNRQSVRKLIPRGYGQTEGCLANGVKVQVIRHAGHFLATNRKLLSRKEIQAFYKLRWAIEESFRYLKTTLKLNRCQQHSMQAQGNFASLCLLTFAKLQKEIEPLRVKTLQTVIFKPTNLKKPMLVSLFNSA